MRSRIADSLRSSSIALMKIDRRPTSTENNPDSSSCDDHQEPRASEEHADPATDELMQANARTESWIQRWWILELGCCTIAITTFACLMIILLYANNRQQRRWVDRKLSLNTIVAIMSTVSRALMIVSISASVGQYKWIWLTRKPRLLNSIEIIDSASRGFLGSLRLLWSVKAT